MLALVLLLCSQADPFRQVVTTHDPFALPGMVRPVVVIFTQSDEACPACKYQRQIARDGDKEVEVQYAYQLPAWVTATPTLYDPKTKRQLVGWRTLPQIKEWIGIAKAPEPPKAAAQPVVQPTGQWVSKPYYSTNRRGRITGVYYRSEWVPAK